TLLKKMSDFSQTPSPRNTRTLGLLAASELLLQRDECPVLQRLHRALGLAEDGRGLGVREVEDELQRQHLLLVEREVLDQLEHRPAPDCLERASLRRGRLVRRRLRYLAFRLPATRRTEMVHREVVRDPEEPGRE